MIRGLPLPQKRLRLRQQGRGLKSAISTLGRYIRPIAKTLARKISPKITKKIKDKGSELISKGTNILTNLAKSKLGGAKSALIKPTTFEDGIITAPTVTRKRKAKKRKKGGKAKKERKGASPKKERKAVKNLF